MISSNRSLKNRKPADGFVVAGRGFVCPPPLPPTRRTGQPTPETHDVVVGIFNTVRTKAPGFLDGYATVILDEAHELCSRANLDILWLAQAVPRVLGLSATPSDRADGLDRVVTESARFCSCNSVIGTAAL